MFCTIRIACGAADNHGDEGVCVADVHIAAEEQPKAGQEQHNNPKFNHCQKYSTTFFSFLNFQKSSIFTQILLHVDVNKEI